jgi:hypothetical protein
MIFFAWQVINRMDQPVRELPTPVEFQESLRGKPKRNLQEHLFLS